MANQPFTLKISRHVYIGDDDASGLIYFASYFKYMAEGDQDFFRKIGKPLTDGINEGISCPCVNAECSFIKPVRAGDDLEQIIRLEAGRRTSFQMIHQFMKGDEVAAEGRLSRVWTDLSTMKSTEVPSWVLSVATPTAPGN
ncbi:MAG: acyl-CoA thioesterase [Ilumatobacteraceae bacterium]